MERERWAEALKDINWLCGRCQEGRLRLPDKDVQSSMTADTQLVFHEDWFDHDDVVSQFTALMTCDNVRCADPVAVSGKTQAEHFQVDWDEYDVIHTWTVEAVTPAPLPFPLPAATPDAVKQRLRSACQLLWSDHDAAGNKIRQAVEALLDDQKVRKAVAVPGAAGSAGRRQSLTLHKRIEAFSIKNPEVGDHLMAIKWIGNAGSHAGQPLTRDDVLDALEIMEVAIDDLYVRTRATLGARVRRILKAKKPVRRK
ncbi:DUF4145 domain-containing protein [Brevundimonas lutea]|uniref:DUF4145 domain-containing protein n=1 Tax=Brevundimonas lutea TaxID=2293980 RepID=UPI0013CF2DA0|nr:DUF4145 domain-containing protein [Brevundimonas lutea]